MPKKDGGLHLILDLHPLNAFLRKDKFKMLTLAQILSVPDPADWMVLLDLQNTYFHILSCRSTGVASGTWCATSTLFPTLPFVLTSAPPLFTKVMSVVAAHLWWSGVCIPLP